MIKVIIATAENILDILRFESILTNAKECIKV